MNYVIMFVGGIIGIFLWSLVKIRSINRRTPDENYKSVFKAFWTFEWVNVIISITVVLAGMFIITEYLDLQPEDETPVGIYGLLKYKIAKFIRTTFILVGFCGHAIVLAFLSVTEKKLQQKAKDGGVEQD